MNKINNANKVMGIVAHVSELDEQDTFFLFVNEAICRPNLEVYVFDTNSILPDGKSVKAKKITSPIYYESRKKLEGQKQKININKFDVIFLKKNPPIDKDCIRFFEWIKKRKVPTVNSIDGMLKIGTKAYLKHFSKVTAKTFYTNTVSSAVNGMKKMGDCVIKQSDSYGGIGVLHMEYLKGKFYKYDGKTKKEIEENKLKKIIQKSLSESRDNTLLVVEYLKSAPKRGDKRVVILDGKRILGSYIRLPDKDKGICVWANNGAKRCSPTKRDYKILKIIGGHLQKNGIGLAALDLLVGEDGIEYLSEINVVNPGFCNLDVTNPHLKVAKQVIDMVLKRVRP